VATEATEATEAIEWHDMQNSSVAVRLFTPLLTMMAAAPINSPP
jgi:hypothetical protein